MGHFRTVWWLAFAVFPAALVVGAADEGEAAPEGDLVTAEQVFPELEEILERAVDQSPRMIDRNLRLLEAEYEAAAAKGRLYPDASGFAYWFEQSDDRADQTENLRGQKLYYDARVTQPLYHWGALRAGTEAAKIRAEIEAQNMKEAYRSLALEVRRAYLGLIIKKAVVKREEFDVTREIRRLDTTRVRVDSGEMPSGAVYAQQLKLSEAEVLLERALHDLNTSLSGFRRLTGMADFNESRVPEEIPEVDPAAEARVRPLRMNFVEKNGMAELEEFKALSLQMQGERLTEHIHRTALRPKVSFQVGVTQNEISYSVNLANRFQVTSLFAGLSVRWNIFDGFESRNKVRASKARQRLLEFRMKHLKEGLAEAAASAADEMRIDGRAMRNSDQRLAYSAGGLAFAEKNVGRGRATQDNVDAAIASETSARIAAFLARATYLNSVADFLSQVDADPVVLRASPKIMNR